MRETCIQGSSLVAGGLFFASVCRNASPSASFLGMLQGFQGRLLAPSVAYNNATLVLPAGYWDLWGDDGKAGAQIQFCSDVVQTVCKMLSCLSLVLCGRCLLGLLGNRAFARPLRKPGLPS
jgi:hypothetical protein